MGSFFNVILFAVNVVIVVGALFPMTTTTGTEFIVGDKFGWTILYNYTTWTQDKVFHVGDKLVFNYPNFLHNVFKVNETAFDNCTKPPLDQAMNSGSDVITLDTPGKKWYICGVADHCSFFNQKLVINVDVIVNDEEPLGKSSTGGCSSISDNLVVVFMVVILTLVLG
ncbi:blue copper protein 1b-like [Impatiens glandulifera]|uniref:blue copper protein 1b-like n=1 Tax=Impatiens glandulifera TaxID=253017 RepID=UPI001FB06AB1|nr:blue copper protein 1b-like [Impatiens glandulifera]